MKRAPTKISCTQCGYAIDGKQFYELRSFRFMHNIRHRFCTMSCVAKWITATWPPTDKPP